jgi:hypothetical protein
VSNRSPLFRSPAHALVPVLYMGVMFWLSSVPGKQLVRWGLTGDHWHAPLYAGLTLATLWAVAGAPQRRFALTGILCVLFGATDEWHQKFVPGRVPALDDFAMDVLGVGLGLAIGAAFSAVWRRLALGTSVRMGLPGGDRR